MSFAAYFTQFLTRAHTHYELLVRYEYLGEQLIE